jgi:hypothetical protein
MMQLQTKKEAAEPLDIPPSIPEEDSVLLENVLTAVKSLKTGSTPICAKYKIDITPTGYLVHAPLPSSSEHFEVHLDDMLFIQSISPARIEHVAVSRRPPNSIELVVRILDCKQRILVTSSVCFSNATRKRKWDAD